MMNQFADVIATRVPASRPLATRWIIISKYTLPYFNLFSKVDNEAHQTATTVIGDNCDSQFGT